MPTQIDRNETADSADRFREIIPRYVRAGVLRRVDLPDGGIQFVVAHDDRVFATFDGRGRLFVPDFVVEGIVPSSLN